MRLTETEHDTKTLQQIADDQNTEVSGARADRLIKRGLIFWQATGEPIGWFLTDLGRAALAQSVEKK